MFAPGGMRGPIIVTSARHDARLARSCSVAFKTAIHHLKNNTLEGTSDDTQNAPKVRIHHLIAVSTLQRATSARVSLDALRLSTPHSS